MARTNRIKILSYLLGAVIGIQQYLVPCSLAQEKPIVIAHRGASGYLPEHTLEAVAMAYAMGADYIEQDVVLSKDSVPVVLHDIHVDTVTNVAAVFPSRRRSDGRFYAADFTVSELKQLSITERIDSKTKKAVFQDRFPVKPTPFQIPTLADELLMIRGLNESTGRNVGVYVEIKAPAWHHRHGKDVARMTLAVLKQHGYTDGSQRVFVQCFDADETQRMRTELQTEIPLIQLIGENSWGESGTDFNAMRTLAGLRQVATYADGIGPWLPHVVAKTENGYAVTELVQIAHQNNLQVHPYTLRADSLPNYVNDFAALHKILFQEAQVDGVFTDFPDRTISFRSRIMSRPK